MSAIELDLHYRPTEQPILSYLTTRNARWRDVLPPLESLGSVRARDGCCKVTMAVEARGFETIRRHRHDVDALTVVDQLRVPQGACITPG